MTLSSSSGSLLRFTQQVQNPKLLAPEMSQKFDEANATELTEQTHASNIEHSEWLAGR
jgi:hypothetical protein